MLFSPAVELLHFLSSPCASIASRVDVKMLTSEGCVQASTALTFNFTSFTLSNFTQSFFLNITNVNRTSVVPAGTTA